MVIMFWDLGRGVIFAVVFRLLFDISRVSGRWGLGKVGYLGQFAFEHHCGSRVSDSCSAEYHEAPGPKFQIKPRTLPKPSRCMP